MTFFLLVLNQIILPITFTVLFHNRDYESRSNFIIQLIFTAVFVSLPLVIGAQSWTSIYIGYLIAGFFIYSVIKNSLSLPKVWAFKIGDSWKQISFYIIQILLIIVFLPLTIWSVSGYSIDENKEVLNLEFPMKNNIYIVGHGGSNPLINYHNVSETQTYALDISALNVIGSRAWGIYPSDLNKYEIFGEELYSPCDGYVESVKKGYKDYEPPKRGDGHPAGNHIEIKCEGALVIIAHMKENSIVVDSSQTVKAGDLLGEVGNSGNTSEPHLHIHAEKDGKGIPIKLDGRFLVRNSLVFN